MSSKFTTTVLFTLSLILSAVLPGAAATLPALGSAQSFAVLAGSTVTNTGATSISGDLGVSPGSAVTGFPPGNVTGGAIHAADAAALQAQTDTTAAYNDLAGQACSSDLTGQDLGGMTLGPGVYCFSTSAQLTGTLTLDAGGDPEAVWVFKTGSSLTSASSSTVQVTNGGQKYNVFWQAGSYVTLGTGTAFTGNILAMTSITLTTGATVSGRALARTGAVTLDSNVVVPQLQYRPTAAKSFVSATIPVGGVSNLSIILTNSNATDINAVAFTDIFPVSPGQMVVAATPNITNSCGGSVSTTGNTLLALSGGTVPRNSSCTVRVDVTAPVSGMYANSSGAISSANTGTGSSAAATLNVITPTLTVQKTAGSATVSPDQEIDYTVRIVNPNPFSINNVAAIDTISPYTALKLGSFQLLDSIPVSGLTMGGGVVSYSDNNGATWSYLPVSGRGGQPAGYDGSVTNWKIDMNPAEAMNGNNGTFSIRFIVRVR